MKSNLYPNYRHAILATSVAFVRVKLHVHYVGMACKSLMYVLTRGSSGALLVGVLPPRDFSSARFLILWRDWRLGGIGHTIKNKTRLTPPVRFPLHRFGDWNVNKMKIKKNFLTRPPEMQIVIGPPTSRSPDGALIERESCIHVPPWYFYTYHIISHEDATMRSEVRAHRPTRRCIKLLYVLTYIRQHVLCSVVIE